MLKYVYKSMKQEHIDILKKEGFSFPDINKLSSYGNIDGVIIKDGTFIACKGFNEHRYMYPLLYSFGLVDSDDWVDDASAIHISSSQLNGRVVSSIAHYMLYGDIATDEQLDTLFSMRKVIDGTYGDNEKVSDILYNYICCKENYGGKYNGLKFLQRFYTHINTPQISKNPNTIKSDKICIRTSPVHSLPGLLTSQFNIGTDYRTYIDKIKSDFKKYESLIERNEIHYFYQQQIDGINGVCHVRGRKKDFTYDASENQGDIVLGKKGKAKLSDKQVNELKSIAVELAEDFNKSIQLEFVVSDKINIVQLRILRNEPEETVLIHPPENVICFGKTFSHGNIDVDVKDIVIVKQDGDSSLLLGKKALIVTEDVEFSHLLALSKALRIPSMFATGDIDFTKKKVKFVAYNKKSWIV